MNPLSSVNAFVQPNGLITLLPKPNLAANIPATELQTLTPSLPMSSTTPVAPEVTPVDGSFSNVLGKLVNEVSAKQSVADDAVSGLLSGQQVPLHQAMIAMQEANVSFQLMVEVRNKLLDSYQELMRMQI
jgi:flagellar hook-basal body complex protein FliE